MRFLTRLFTIIAALLVFVACGEAASPDPDKDDIEQGGDDNDQDDDSNDDQDDDSNDDQDDDSNDDQVNDTELDGFENGGGII